MANPEPTDTSGDGLGQPARSGYVVNPDDTCILTTAPRALYVGSAGTVVVEMHDGTPLTFVGVTAGSFLPIRARKVKKTGTTAGNILGLY